MPSAAILLSNNKWVKPTDIKATGRGNRLLKGDVLAYLKNNKPGATPSAKPQQQQQQQQGAKKPQAPSYTDIPTSQIRKVIASRLLESKQTIPHFYATTEASLDNFLKYVKPKIKVSVNDFIIYAASRALERVPECNVVYDAKAKEHKQMENIDISFAVATDKGLITPIIPKTNTLSLEKISAKVKDLSTRARENKLKPEEFQGGTFCISNLGMFGVNHFAAVINPPHGIILAIGGSTVKPKESLKTNDLDAFADNLSKDNAKDVEFGTFVSVTAASDARAIDGATVGKFLYALKEELSLINTPIVA
jgi:pyruvate/2-oxoglutarate dehydrogenase complex dihydrolipoamide acyltransferase (E2) component